MRFKALKIRYKSVLNVDGDKIYELQDSGDVLMKAKKQDSINFFQLYDLIIQKGFPTNQRVGKEGFRNTTSILESYIEQFNDHPHWKQLKKIIAKEIENKTLTPYYLAKLQDFYLFKTNQPVKYATRISYFSQVQNEYIEYKVEQPKELNKRRKSIGLCPIAVECWSLAMELPLSLQGIK